MERFISIIVSTYNRPDALRLVLLALAEQSDREFEVIVADDGSTTETRFMLESLRAQLPYVLYHIWQVDDGFRAAAIRNKAAAVAQGKYLIFLDGDCVPRVSFVAKHRALAEKQHLVAGNRVLLGEKFTKQVLARDELLHHWNYLDWLLARLSGKSNRILPFVPLCLPRKFRKHRWQGVKTCNLGIFKQDFLAANGFDESYCGWGYEDSDLAIRLLRLGLRRKDGHGAIPVVHLWHKENDRAREPFNYQRLQSVNQSSRVKTGHGVDQYL